MKQFVTIILFGLLATSFAGDAGLFPFQEKAKIELGEDFDSEKDLKDKAEKNKYAAVSNITFQEGYSDFVKICSLVTTDLPNISFEVDIRPPRA